MLLLAGCSSTREIKWTEEVRLRDGTVVQVKRKTEMTKTGFPTQTRGFPLYHELCYPPLALHWKSKPEYRPYVFDIVEGKAYIKIRVAACIECNLQGYTKNDALYFAWDNGVWRKVEENDALKKLRFNLLSSPNGDGNDPGLVTLAEKEQRDHSIYGEMKASGRTGPGSGTVCQRCGTENIRTDRTSEVFLPAERTSCN